MVKGDCGYCMMRRSCSAEVQMRRNSKLLLEDSWHKLLPSARRSVRHARPHVVIVRDSVAAEAIAKLRCSTDTRECVPGPIHNGAQLPPIHPRHRLTSQPSLPSANNPPRAPRPPNQQPSAARNSPKKTTSPPKRKPRSRKRTTSSANTPRTSTLT
jgi:hypothetical protein